MVCYHGLPLATALQPGLARRRAMPPRHPSRAGDVVADRGCDAGAVLDPMPHTAVPARPRASLSVDPDLARGRP